MALPDDWSMGKCLEWCTQLPLKDRPQTSPVFIIKNVEYYFYFCRTFSYYNEDDDDDDDEDESSTHYYKLYVKSKAPSYQQSEFSFIIYVNYDAASSSHFTRHKAYFSDCTTSVFQLRENQIRTRVVDLAVGFPIRYFFIFEHSDGARLPSKIKTEDKYMQTATYLNDDTYVDGLHKDFSGLYDTKLNHDAKIICGEQSIKVHKMVLCMRSEVFKAMLHSNMQESKAGVIKIIDMDDNCIQDFIRYLYTDSMPELTLSTATVLYEAGDKYHIKSLMYRCSEYLQDNLSAENVYQCYTLADAHSDQKLKDGIVSYILENKIYLQYKYWESFCENFPKLAIEIYKLSHQNN